MGQKANPNSIRLILNKEWKSKWFSQKNFQRLLLEDLILKKTIGEKTNRFDAISNINIERYNQQIKIIIYSAKPGIIIGRSGQGINDLTQFLNLRLEEFRRDLPYNMKKSYVADKKNVEKIKIDIIEVKDPELNATLVGQTICRQLEKRIGYRKAIKQAINKVMQRKAKGIKIAVAGRLGGVEIARSEKFSEGSIPLSTFKAHVDYAYETAFTAYGTIGVKVWIYRG